MPRVIEDWQWVVLTIVQESSNQPFEGMVAVAEVIRDRSESKYNSDGSIVGTVLAPYQFSGWNTEDKNRVRAANYDLDSALIVRAISAYKLAFEHRSNYAKGANLYHADWMNPYPSWTENNKVKRLTQIGNHIFYKEER